MIHIRVRVTTDAPRERIEEDGRVLHLFVKEPAEGNMANRRVAVIIARRYNVPASRVRIVAGHHAQRKTLAVNM